MRFLQTREAVWGMVLITFALIATGLAIGGCHLSLRQEVQPDLRLTCGVSLTHVGQALERFRHEHGAYPTSLDELVPNDIKSLPSCAAPDSRGWSPDYVVSCDRKFYGLACTADHQGRGPALPTAFASVPDVSLPAFYDDCVRAMRAEGLLVQKDIARGRTPLPLNKYRLPLFDQYTVSQRGPDPTCASSHKLTPRNDGTFQILCTNPGHVRSAGLMILQPRFESSTGGVISKSYRGLGPQTPPSRLPRQVVAGMWILLSLRFLWFCRTSLTRRAQSKSTPRMELDL